MITAPGAELFAEPLPATMYASKIPRPGPGFASNKKKIDFPISSTCFIPSGDKIPWLIALFKNNTFAGSMNTDASGRIPRSTKNPTPTSIATFNISTNGVTPTNATHARNAPIIPREKLLVW